MVVEELQLKAVHEKAVALPHEIVDALLTESFLLQLHSLGYDWLMPEPSLRDNNQKQSDHFVSQRSFFVGLPVFGILTHFLVR